MGVCVEYICGCVNEVWMVVTGCGVCVLEYVGGWVSKFWTSSILVYMYVNTHYKHVNSVLNSI